jgi:hypothetical protein
MSYGEFKNKHVKMVKMVCIDNTWKLFGKTVAMNSLLKVGEIYEGFISANEFSIRQEGFSYGFGFPLEKFISQAQSRENRINEILDEK